MQRRSRARPSRTSFRAKRALLVAAACAALVLLQRVLGRNETQTQGALLWSTPRSGGFNNQLITVYEAVRCAQLTKRRLVLPLIYENVRADTSSKGFGPYEFEDYFDSAALQNIVDVTTPRLLDEEGLPCDTIFFTNSKHFKANARRIPRLLKQQYAKRYAVNLSFVDDQDVHSSETCVDDSFCSIPPEFGSYSVYNESGQGFNIRKSPVLRKIRAAFRPSTVVQDIAGLTLKTIGGSFNAMHIRRGDFETKCVELPAICEEYGNNSFVQSPEWILEKAARFRNPSLPLFVSTTHADECRELLKDGGLRLIFMDDVTLPHALAWTLQRTDILSFASQIVSSRGDDFVGNRFSSYTTEINNMRYLRNPRDKLAFF